MSFQAAVRAFRRQPAQTSFELPSKENTSQSSSFLYAPAKQAADSSRPTSATTASFAHLSPEAVAARLDSHVDTGLSSSASLRKYSEYGTNELEQEEPEPIWLRFLKQFQETLILLLLASAAASMLMGNFDDAISITVAVTIVITVGVVQEYKSEESIAALSKMVPHYAHVIRPDIIPSVVQSERRNSSRTRSASRSRSRASFSLENSEKSLTKASDISITVPAVQLVPGDLVLFNAGDRIPADIRIVRSVDLTIDESNLTGETEPVDKDAATLAPSTSSQAAPAPAPAPVPIQELKNIAFMGTLVSNGHGAGIVVATGPKTELGLISASLKEIESPRTPLQQSMDRLGKDLSYMSFGVIAFIMVVGLIRGWKFLDMFTIGVSLAVAAIPEGLPIIVTVTLALGVQRMSSRHAIVRRLPSVETLGSVNVVCSDKTGTLTTNHMTVKSAWHFQKSGPAEPFPLADLSNKSQSDFEIPMQSMLRIGNIANSARLVSSNRATNSSLTDTAQKSRWAGSQTDVAILDLVDALRQEDIRGRLGPKADETPFNSDRKWMGCVIKASSQSPSQANTSYLKGAYEVVLDRCATYLDSDGRTRTLDSSKKAEAIQAAEKMAREGLRVIAFASGSPTGRQSGQVFTTPMPSSPPNGQSLQKDDYYQELTLSGLIGVYDPPRAGVDRAIKSLHAGKVRVMMITGDSEITAAAIARKIGILEEEPTSTTLMTGRQLEQTSEAELSRKISTVRVFARTTPDQKMKIIRALQANDDVVSMTGDGVNDAPALKKADIGISMGIQGTDVAKEASDMILTDDNFSTILGAIEEGKGIFYNIQNFLSFQLSTSAAALGLVLVSTLAGYANPLNAMQILWINILMDGPPAQSLGVEPVDAAVMRLPPRKRNSRVLTKPLLTRVFQSALVIMSGTLLVYILEMAADGAITARDTTMTFTCFVLFDMFNALSCRSESKSVLKGEVKLFGSGSNKMFNYAVGGSLLGQALVIYFPPLQRIFQTEAIGFMDWIMLIAISSSVFWVDEARKWHQSGQKSSSMMNRYSANV